MPNPTHRTRLSAGAGSVLLLLLLLVALAAVAGCGGSNPATAPVVGETSGAAALEQQFVRMVDAVSPTVVQIQSSQGLGSGIVFNDQGDIVTNAHVTAGHTGFTVSLPGGGRHSGTLVGTDPGNDLAVVHITGATPAPAAFADSSKAQVGDLVLAIGNPLGLQSSVSQGIVSSLNRSVSEGNGVTLNSAIQTSAEINPGNSGGALVDLSGRVLGIPTLAALDPELGGAQAPGIGFAIPSNTVRNVANRLITRAG